MNVFEIIGIATSVIVVSCILLLLGLLLKDFIGYQIGARNTRNYNYSGPPRSQWFWTCYGAKKWIRSARYGGGWYFETEDPENGDFDLRVYENGKIERIRVNYPDSSM